MSSNDSNSIQQSRLSIDSNDSGSIQQSLTIDTAGSAEKRLSLMEISDSGSIGPRPSSSSGSIEKRLSIMDTSDSGSVSSSTSLSAGQEKF